MIITKQWKDDDASRPQLELFNIILASTRKEFEDIETDYNEYDTTLKVLPMGGTNRVFQSVLSRAWEIGIPK